MHRHVVVRRQRPPFSIRIGVGSLAVLAAALAGTAVLLAFGVGSGDYPISPIEVLGSLVGGGDDTSQFVIWTLRLPRLTAAVLVGAALAVSGAIFQALSRNPLVAPDIVGVNGGAAVGAVGIIILGGPVALVAPAAFIGALSAALLLYVLAWRGGVAPYRLVLIGIGIAALAGAVVGYLLTRGDVWDIQRANVWLIGSLSAADWGDVGLLAGSLAILLPLTFILSRDLSALQLGDDAAAGLGVTTERTRLVLLVIAVGLAAVSVSVGGPIAFVAFIAPHLARRLARVAGSGVIPAAAAIGGLLLIGADIAARRVLDPTDLPVGILTVVLGAPYFLWLLARSHRRGAMA